MARFAPAISNSKATKSPRAVAPKPKPRASDRAEGTFSLAPMTGAQAPPILAKLEIGEPNDEFEKEADAVADHVMRMTDAATAPPEPPDPTRTTSAPLLQRACAKCEQVDEKLQRDAAPGASTAMAGPTPAGFAIHLAAARASGGSALPSTVRSFMERRFGQDLGHVRVHQDARADRLTRSVQARAFTVGRDLFFKQGEFQPSSSGGRRLIAHELTHTLQQRALSSPNEIARRQPAASAERRKEVTPEPKAGDLCEVASTEAAVVVGVRTRKSLKPGSRVEVVDGRHRGDARWVLIRVVDAAPGSEVASLTVAPMQRALLGACLAKAPKDAAAIASAPPLGSSAIQVIAEVPITFAASKLPAGAGGLVSAGGLSLHVLASGDMSWLAGPLAARRVLSADYWSPLLVRQSTVVLDRLVNQLPRNLAPKIEAELALQAELGAQRLSWLQRGFTEAELRSIPDLVSRLSEGGQLGAAELAMLRRAAAIHIGGSTPGAPFASYMNPEHALNSVGPREYRVRVELPRSSALDVSKANAFNEGLDALTNVEEGEWLVTSSERGRILSVQRGSASQAGFLLRHAEKIRWGGRALFVVGAGISAYRIATAAPSERVKVVGEEVGGQVGGFAGAAAAVAGCVLLGIATGGVGLFVCGLVGGIGGGLAGSAVGGALASGAPQGGAPCPSCHALQREQAERSQRIDFGALEAIGKRREGMTADDVAILKLWLGTQAQSDADVRALRRWLESLPPRKP